ncbi:MAG: glycosyltransferase [Lacibacter sp.]
MLWLFITALLLLPYVALLLLYRYWWCRQKPLQVPAGFEPATRFSIIIPARNEAHNLPACLQSVAALDYPKHLYEVIVVDDFSEDATAIVAASFPGVRVLRMHEQPATQGVAFKKRALSAGIAAATGDYIVTTDADCEVPPGWLRVFAYIIATRPVVHLIAAPVAMRREKNFLQLFQSLDFLSLQGITASSVQAGVHSMCNGANLCYSRAAFYNVGGFAGIDHIASGDDMLLMHKMYSANPAAIHYAFSTQSIVQTEPVATVRAFFLQRIRWASKATAYTDRRIFWVLLLVYLVNLWLLLLLPAGLLQQQATVVFAGALLLKTIAELYFLIPVARFFGKQPQLLWFPLLQLHHILYTVVAGWLGAWGRYEWKGRMVR